MTSFFLARRSRFGEQRLLPTTVTYLSNYTSAKLQKPPQTWTGMLTESFELPPEQKQPLPLPTEISHPLGFFFRISHLRRYRTGIEMNFPNREVARDRRKKWPQRWAHVARFPKVRSPQLPESAALLFGSPGIQLGLNRREETNPKTKP